MRIFNSREWYFDYVRFSRNGMLLELPTAFFGSFGKTFLDSEAWYVPHPQYYHMLCFSGSFSTFSFPPIFILIVRPGLVEGTSWHVRSL